MTSPQLWVVTQTSLLITHMINSSILSTFITMANDQAQAIAHVRALIGESQAFPERFRDAVTVSWDAAPIRSNVVRCFTPSAVL